MTDAAAPRRFDMLTAVDNLITFAEVRDRVLEADGRDQGQVFEHLATRLLRMLTGEEPTQEHIASLLELKPKEAA